MSRPAPHDRPSLAIGPLVAWILAGCTGSGANAEVAAGEGEAAGPDSVESGGGEGPGAGGGEDPGLPLLRGIGHDSELTEVWLDPRAGAALSLDRGGGVRLWPTLPPREIDLAKLAPIRVPLREPTALSLAQAGPGRFVIAALDTAQAARVLEIVVDEGGAARVHERFAIGPEDPQLELHVLDGGDRLLALGVDHRLRLFDGHGAVLAELAEDGLVPWQLRFAGPPEALQLAIVLAGPTRLQRLSIAGDRIARVGEPHPVLLDRGPNQNDLALLPSGKHAAVLRRPKAKSSQWSLEIHDLDSGEVRVMWGEAVAELRPRLHVVDEARALLEDGSGAGFWLDLRGGVVMPAPFELPKALETLPPESRVEPTRIGLPDSNQESRRRASVVAGLRAVPHGDALILDPLDDPQYHQLAQRGQAVRSLALDPAGEQLAQAFYAVSTGGREIEFRLTVTAVADGSALAVTGCGDQPIETMAFTDAEHLLLVSNEQVRLCAWRSGELVAEVAVPIHHSATIRVTEPGAGVLGLASYDDEADDDTPKITALSFRADGLGTPTPVPRSGHGDWPEIDGEERTLARDGQGRRYDLPKVDTRQFSITGPDDQKRAVRFADDKREVSRLLPSADGRRVAVVHVHEQPYDYEYYYGNDDPESLSVWDLSAEIPRLAWEQPAVALNLSWSADGSRLALDRQPGVRVVEGDGEIVFAQRRGPLVLDALPDPEPTASTPAP